MAAPAARMAPETVPEVAQIIPVTVIACNIIITVEIQVSNSLQ